MVLHRIPPGKLVGLWDAENYGSFFFKLMTKCGMLHKFEYPWSKYFMVVVESIKTGQITK